MQRMAVAAMMLLGTVAWGQSQLANLVLPQFSGDMAITRKDSQGQQVKIYMGGTRMRSEMAMRGHDTVAIMDMGKKVAYILMPQMKMYMESSMEEPSRHGAGFADLMKLAATNDPCSTRKDATCTKAGTETVNGRSCDKWLMKTSNGPETVWMDQKLHFPIRKETAESTLNVTNVKEGSQPESLFEVPAGYRKFDPRMMQGMGEQNQ